MRRVALFLPVTVLLAGFALAWNPISVQSGGALRWDASAAIEWNPDGGVLGRWSNATATAEMGTALGVWQNVSTAVITYSQGTQIENTSGTPVDVDSSNYAEIINLPGQNPIIYDNDRDIYDMLGVPDGVLGFAGVLRTDGAGTITQGFAVFQGDWIDDDTGDVGDVTDLVYQGVVVPEFGHFSGLGHTTVNRHLTSGIGSCAPTTNFATMNPFIHSGASTTHNDDRAGISALYPTSGYAGRASISGNLIGLDGVNGFDGANMILRQDTTSCSLIYSQVQAMQSGVNPGEDGGDATTNFIAASDNDTVGENTAFVGYSFDDNVPTSFVHITDPSVGAPADRTWMVRAVGANLPPSGTIRLSWGEPCNADSVPGQDFAVYEGAIASLSGVQDHAPIACGTGLEHQ